MKFSVVLLSVVATALANNIDVATVLLADVKANLNEYVALIGGTVPIPADLISYYTEVATYTDNSYTTLLANFPADEYSTIITQFPWYSSRLKEKLDVAYTEGEAASVAESTSAPASTTASSAPASSSAAAASSAPESSSAAATTSVDAQEETSETSAASSTAEVETYSGAAANLNQYLPLILASPLLSLLL